MSRASYQRRRTTGSAIGIAGQGRPDTTAFAARLRAAVEGLARHPDARARDEIAGTVGALCDGQGGDGVWRVLPGALGEPMLVWSAGMDEALKALARGDFPLARARLDLLTAARPLERTPGRALFAALEGLVAELDMLRSLGDGHHPGTGAGAGS